MRYISTRQLKLNLSKTEFLILPKRATLTALLISEDGNSIHLYFQAQTF